MSSEWYVYILRCADGSLYTGATNDLAARVRAHNDGKGAKYTRGRLPVVLVYSEPAADRGAAQRRERVIKRLSTAMKRRLLDTPVLCVAPPENNAQPTALLRRLRVKH